MKVGMKRKLDDINGDGKLFLLPCSLSKRTQVTDFFSQLPEEILVNILSLLPLKDAVQTSILSHSFKNACSSLRSISFNWRNVFKNHNNVTRRCCCMDYKHKFVTCVNQYLQFNQATNLDYLEITFCLQLDDKEFIDNWLRNILSRDVDTLHLYFCCPLFDNYVDTNRLPFKRYSFSRDFFGGLSKLRHLVLGDCQFDQDWVANFDNLISLDLRRVVFKNFDLQNSLHSMPNLQGLYINHTILPKKLSFHCLPFLRNVRLFNCRKLRKMELRSDVLEGLYVKLDREIKVNWSALPNMKIIGVKANADELRYIFTHFPAKYPLLQILSVSSNSDWGSCIPDSISKFSHLKMLRLYFFWDHTFDILKLIHVLRASPHLTELRLLIQCTTEIQRSELEIGEFMLQSLKEVNIRGLFSTPSQIELIKYLLKSAPALKIMDVWKIKDAKLVPWDQGQREHIVECIDEALGGDRVIYLTMLPKTPISAL